MGFDINTIVNMYKNNPMYNDAVVLEFVHKKILV